MFFVITPTIRVVLHSLVASALLFLTACGGGDDGIPLAFSPDPNPDPSPDSSPVTGTFVPGPVEGLHYETATQSGLTNAAGEFQYLEGETITFSIGGIEFGSALGATEINLPQLLDTTLPTTEVGLRAELKIDQEKRRDDVTDFDRMANAAMLLMALDADGDASNGLDLSGWHEKLENESVNFDTNFYYFPTPSYNTHVESRLENINNNGLLRLRNTAQIPGDIPVLAPLYYLYEALGISVPVQVDALYEEDLGNDNVIDYRRTFGYDDRMFTSRGYDFDADDIVDSERRYTWDNQGRQISQTESEDANDDGIIDSIGKTEHSWGDNGNLLVRSEEDDTNADGVAEQSGTATYTYDGINPAEILQEFHNDADGIPDGTSIQTFTYDDEGRIQTEVTDNDVDGDGTPDGRTTRTFIYDAAGNLTSEVKEEDTDFDGLVDTIFRYTYTYDLAGNELSEVEERIDDPQGAPNTVNYRYSDTYTYDGAGNRLTSVHEGDTNADDIIDERRKITSTYDADGNRLTQIRENDFDADGNNEYENHYEYQYDADGNRTSYREEYRDPTQPDTIRLQTYSYDDQGNQTQEVVEDDNTGGVDGHDGAADSRTTYTYVYNETGHLISTTDEDDADADGTVDQTDVETYSYQTLDQGIMYMLYQYAE